MQTYILDIFGQQDKVLSPQIVKVEKEKGEGIFFNRSGHYVVVSCDVMRIEDQCHVVHSSGKKIMDDMAIQKVQTMPEISQSFHNNIVRKYHVCYIVSFK